MHKSCMEKVSYVGNRNKKKVPSEKKEKQSKLLLVNKIVFLKRKISYSGDCPDFPHLALLLWNSEQLFLILEKNLIIIL